MKHLLTAALIATALASPVMGEGIYIECVNVADPSEKTVWTLYRDTMRAVFDDAPLYMYEGIVRWTDKVVVWNSFVNEYADDVFTYLLDVETMQMMKAYVVRDFVVDTLFECTRPL